MRAKSINEIRRGGNPLEKMGVGLLRASPARHFVTSLCPACVTDTTLLERISGFLNRTSYHNKVRSCMERFLSDVGDPEDFSALDFGLRRPSDGVAGTIRPGVLEAVHDRYFSVSSTKFDELRVIFDVTVGVEDLVAMFRCEYNERDCIGHVDMADYAERAFLSCYFIK